MFEAFESGGYIMWPLALISIALVWLTVRAALQLRQRPDTGRAEISLLAILFWGVMSLVLGVLGTAVGWISVTQALAAAGGATPALLWSGIRITLYPFTFGLVICTTAALCWFVLRQWALRSKSGA